MFTRNTLTTLVSTRSQRFARTTASVPLIASLGALGLVIVAAPAAQAQTTVYNFQIGAIGGGGSQTTYSGQAALGSLVTYTGNTFNREVLTGGSYQSGGTANTLLNSNGVAASGVVFKYDATSNALNGSDTTATDPQTLLQGFAYTGATSHISLVGLPANAPFKAVFYGENGGYADGRMTNFILTDSTFTTVKASAVTTANSATAFTTNPGNYVFFTGTTDASGGIYATYASYNNSLTEGDFDGAQFAVGPGTTAAPEPTALLLLAPGALGLVATRRASRKRDGRRA